MSPRTPKLQGKKPRNRGNLLTKTGSMVGHLRNGGAWNCHFPESGKYFQGPKFAGRNPEILQKERLAKFQAPKFENSEWETDLHTPPVLGGEALFDNSAPAVYKNQGPQGTEFLYTAGAEGSTSQHWRCIKISLPHSPKKCNSIPPAIPYPH